MEAERLDEEHEEPSEVVTALTVRKAQPRPTSVQATETTHTVPYTPRPNTESVIKAVTTLDQAENIGWRASQKRCTQSESKHWRSTVSHVFD